MFKKRTRTAHSRVKDDPTETTTTTAGSINDQATTERAESGQDQEETSETGQTLQEILLLRKLGKQRQNAGIDLIRLNKGDDGKSKKKKKGGKKGSSERQEGEGEGEGEEQEEYGLKQSRAGANEDAGDDAEDDDASKARRLVRSNNFTQQTNALDVDKHMMAYIEAELAKRRGGSGQTDDQDPSSSSKTQADDPQEELYAIAEKYRIEKKQGGVDDDEGNVTTSLGMLTSIPEVDLGMDIRLKNIEQTERAKRAMLENRGQGRGQGRKRNEADESFAAARFYRPHHTVQSDAEALEDAKREVQGLPPLNRGHQRERNETATDDQVYERFKKRVRKN